MSDSEESFRKNATLSSLLMRRVEGVKPLSVMVMMWLLLSGGMLSGDGSASEASYVGRKQRTAASTIEGRKS